jgi:hypothetical protein
MNNMSILDNDTSSTPAQPMDTTAYQRINKRQRHFSIRQQKPAHSHFPPKTKESFQIYLAFDSKVLLAFKCGTTNFGQIQFVVVVKSV